MKSSDSPACDVQASDLQDAIALKAETSRRGGAPYIREYSRLCASLLQATKVSWLRGGGLLIHPALFVLTSISEQR